MNAPDPGPATTTDAQDELRRKLTDYVAKLVDEEGHHARDVILALCHTSAASLVAMEPVDPPREAMRFVQNFLLACEQLGEICGVDMHFEMREGP